MHGIVLLEVTPEQSIQFKRYNEWYKLFEKGKYKGNFDNYCEECEESEYQKKREKKEYQKKREESEYQKKREESEYQKKREESEYDNERNELLHKLGSYKQKDYDKLEREFIEQTQILKKLQEKMKVKCNVPDEPNKMIKFIIPIIMIFMLSAFFCLYLK